MKRKRRDRRHRDDSDLPVGEVDQADAKRRDAEFVAAFFLAPLAHDGGLLALSAIQAAEDARRLSNSAIRSASVFAVPRGRPVVLSGRIDPRDTSLGLGPRHLLRRAMGTNHSAGAIWNLEWALKMVSIWPPDRPPFTLVRDEAVVAINGRYAIEEPSASHEIGRLRYSGFRPGDEVVVIGTTERVESPWPGSMAAHPRNSGRLSRLCPTGWLEYDAMASV